MAVLRIGVLAINASVPFLLWGQGVKPPTYSETSIVDYATGRPTLLTVNSLAVIHGDNLSYITRARLESDLQGGKYRNVLPEANVAVKLRGSPAAVEFASPNLVIFVVPPNAGPGKADIQVIRQGLAGQKASVEIRSEMPLIYPAEEDCLLARHAGTGEWVETPSPATPGEEVLLYAGGLGALVLPLREMTPPLTKLPIAKARKLKVLLDGRVLPPTSVVYAGSLVGYAGIYEIRVRLPYAVGEDPRVTLILDDLISQVPMKLPLRYSTAQPEAPLPR